MRKIALTLAAILTIALSGTTLAANGGTTSESLTLASTVSLTVPASVTYADLGFGNGLWAANVDMTDFSTDNPTGAHITAKFSDLAGPVTLGIANRGFAHNAGADNLPGGSTTDYAVGSLTDTATAYTIANVTAPVTGRTASYQSQVSGVTVPGTYTGTIVFAVVAN